MKNESSLETKVPQLCDEKTRKSHTIEMIEKRYEGKLISKEDLVKLGFGEFIEWLSSIIPYGNFEKSCFFLECGRESGLRVKCKFYSNEYEYGISATLPNGKDKGYLGCISSCRTPLVGETWTRGSDLPDGKYSKETFDEIVCAIVRNEIKTLECFK